MQKAKLKKESKERSKAKVGGPVVKATGGISQPIVMKHTVPAKSTHLSTASQMERRRDQSQEGSPSSMRR